MVHNPAPQDVEKRSAKMPDGAPPALRVQWLRFVCLCCALQAALCAALAVWRVQITLASAIVPVAPLLFLLGIRAPVWATHRKWPHVILAAMLVYPALLQGLFGGFGQGVVAVTLALFVPIAAALNANRRAGRLWRGAFSLLMLAGALAECLWLSTRVWQQAAGLYGVQLLLGWVLSLGLSQVRYQAEAALESAHAQVEELQESQEDLGAASKVKSDFLASMSHEIRTPMHAISGMADMLLLSEQLGPTEYMQAENIKLASQNLIGLINDILDISKIEAGKLELYEERYDFASMFHDVVSIINLRARERGLSFLTQVDPDIPKELVGDSVRVRQVLLNLLGNAVKFTECGSVTLTAQRIYRDSLLMLRFEVADTGVGIPPEQIDHLFGAFEQLDSTRAQNRQGTGLGLAISRRLVELMHSELTVRSTPGEGTRFEFTIAQQVVNDEPIASVAGSRDKRLLICSDDPSFYENAIEMAARLKVKAVRGAPAEAAGYTHMLLDLSAEAAYAWIRQPTPLGCQRALLIDPATTLTAYIRMNDRVLFHPLHVMSMSAMLNDALSERASTPIQQARECLFQARDVRVLLIDDNEVNLMVAANLLKLYGIEVDQAISGEQGIAKLMQGAFDIVFVDHIMPGMDGVDTVRAIRAMGGRYTAQVLLMLSANVMPESRKLFIRAGAQDMLAKPIELPKLSQMLHTYLPPEKCLGKQVISVAGGYLQARLQQIGQALSPLELTRAIRLLEDGRIEEVDAFLSELQEIQVKLELITRHLASCVLRYSRQWTLLPTLRCLDSLMSAIGAQRLAAYARLLVRSLEGNDVAFVRENLRTLVRRLQHFYAQLRDALVACDIVAPHKPEDLRLLEGIEEALAGFQFTEAQELFTVLRAIGPQTERARIEAFHARLQAFEYAQALTLVRAMLDDRAKSEPPRPRDVPLPAGEPVPQTYRPYFNDADIEAARDNGDVRPRSSMDEIDFDDDEIPPEYAQEFADEMAAMLAASPKRQ